ncbi:MAG TPA: M20/M25/M40 family metallo-hydrolase [Anaerovoracaceae bacterium]|nr:M20/M25/M40 family metallo-hydrolase [Anaerovoracaceae bacterium]
MKRLTAAALVLCMFFTAFTGCTGNEEEENNDAAIQTAILYEFSKISQIPRESGYEKEISTYLRSWAKENGLEGVRDSSNNVIITLPASPGYEDAPVTIIQSNMDSKIAVSADKTFDPLNDPVTVTDDGITLSAEGTSIGADSGSGMATALYILKHARKHGPVRAVFTVNGESGMTGAEKLNEKYLEGDYLINLSWDSGSTVGIGSGGTASFDMTHKIEWTAPQNAIPYTLSLSGLNGGEADKDIGKGGANAIKVIGEILANAQGRGILFELGSFNGGVSRDTIATAASALIIINESDVNKMQDLVDDSIEAFGDAYGDVEEHYAFTYQEAQMPEKVVSFEDTGSIISFIYGILNGVQKMSEEYAGVVESASNLGMVSTVTGDFICQVTAASNSDVELYKITSAHEAISSMSGLEYTYYEGVPRWPDHSDSVLYSAIRDIFSELYGDKPDGAIVHHELEFGWFAKKNPRLQIVSIGPTIENPGLPDEALVLETVTRPVNVVLTFLERINEIGKVSGEPGNENSN